MTLPPIPTIIPTSPTGPAPQPTRPTTRTGFHSILPSGTRGRYSLPELGAHLTTGAQVPHCCDQLPMYNDLVYATPGLTQQDIPKYFKDGSFGVRPEDVERTYHPRARRDGRARPRLRRPARLRHDPLGGDVRARLRRRRGPAVLHGRAAPRGPRRALELRGRRQPGPGRGAVGGRALHRGRPRAPGGRPAEATSAPRARRSSGTPRTTSRASTSTSSRPSSTRRSCRASTRRSASRSVPTCSSPRTSSPPPRWWAGSSARAAARSCSSPSSRTRSSSASARRSGAKAFQDFRAAEDPEAPVTVFERRFPYQAPPKRPRGVARPDTGTLKLNATGTSGSFFPGTPVRASNALLVSGAESRERAPADGRRPAGRLLQPADPDGAGRARPRERGRPGDRRPGRRRSSASTSTSSSAAGATTPGARPPPARTSSTPSRSSSATPRTTASAAAARPIEVLEKTNRWVPTLADQTKAGSQKLRAERTKLGLVAGRGKVKGKNVIFTKLRSTYFHEVDSAAGFMDFNTPEVVKDTGVLPARGREGRLHVQLVLRRRRAHRVLQLGPEPGAGAEHRPRLPGGREPRVAGLEPGHLAGALHPLRAAPAGRRPGLLRQLEQQAGQGLPLLRRQRLLLHLPLRPARGPRQGADRGRAQGHAAAADRRDGAGRDRPTCARTSTSRSRCASSAGRRTRCSRTPWPSCGRGGATAATAATTTGTASTSTPTRSGSWTRGGRAGCRPSSGPTLGAEAFKTLTETVASTTRPTATATTSARPTRAPGTATCPRTCAPRSARRCAGSTRARTAAARKQCRARLRRSLKAAAKVPASELYGDDAVCKKETKLDPQWCFDAVRQRPTGGATQPLIHWINRPTFQQAVEIPDASA